MPGKLKPRKSAPKRTGARRDAKQDADKLRTAYDAALAAGVIGCERGGPKDLSTNPVYFEGFGENAKRT